MTQEEKSLMFKDLSARLPYGVIVETTWADENAGKNCDGTIGRLRGSQIEFFKDGDYSDIKPYLRPLSSMTEEERKIQREHKRGIMYQGSGAIELCVNRYVEWLDSKHFDWRTDSNGKTLIENGLAFELTEEREKYLKEIGLLRDTNKGD